LLVPGLSIADIVLRHEPDLKAFARAIAAMVKAYLEAGLDRHDD
jgi:hypothetical protein